ncbi:hypothetical protein LCGC14_0338000 [marine sediment metagenome]|uniref:Large polyvalent protein associated domain-containing protein n=1 Tax=marine sediment metagenome TaxID=412755 RepID=A0A0F9W1P5_9ZZZZ
MPTNNKYLDIYNKMEAAENPETAPFSKTFNEPDITLYITPAGVLAQPPERDEPVVGTGETPGGGLAQRTTSFMDIYNKQEGREVNEKEFQTGLEPIAIPRLEDVSEAGLPEELALGDPRQMEVALRPFVVPGAIVRGAAKEVFETENLDEGALGILENILDAAQESGANALLRGQGVTGEDLLKARGYKEPGFVKSFGVDLITDPLIWGLYKHLLAPSTWKAISVALPALARRITGKIAIPAQREWKRLLRVARGESKLGAQRASEIGKELVASKELVEAISQRAGKPIGPAAIEERLGQLKRGGLTTIEEFDNIINPINAEYDATWKVGQELDIFPQDTFIKALSRKEINQLVLRRRSLENEIERLSGGRINRRLDRLKGAGKRVEDYVEITAENWELYRDELDAMDLLVDDKPLPQLINQGFRVLKSEGVGVPALQGEIAKTARAARKFPGRAKQIGKIVEKIDDIEFRIQTAYRLGGTAHMRRMYLVNELAREPSGYPFKRMRMNLSGTKRRLDLPPEWRKAHGEITKPAFPVARAMAEMKHDIAYAKMFKTILNNPEWADDVARVGFKQLPKRDNLGVLNGKYVHPEIFNELEFMTRQRGNWSKLMGEITATWKFFKVIANPPTHFRNIMSNSILADLGGLPLRTQPKYLTKALNEFRNEGKHFQAMMNDGALQTTFADIEVQAFVDGWATVKEQDALTKFIKVKRNIGNKLGAEHARKIYAAEENIFKLAKYIHNREARGMSHIDAVDDALKWLFDYSDVPRIVHILRSSPLGAPFVTFVYKALPRVAEAAVNNPVRFWKYPLAFMGMEEFARLKKGESVEEMKARKEDMPDYMKVGYYLSLPFKDKNDRTLYLDLTYILPWGDIAEQGDISFLKGIVPRGVQPLQHPVSKGAIEILTNKNMFLSGGGRDVQIWNPTTDGPAEIAEKVGSYFWKQWLPAWAGIPGTELKGYSWQRVQKAIEGEFGLGTGGVNFYGQPPDSLKQAIANAVFGLKTKSVDEPLERRKRIRGTKMDIRKIRARIRSTQRDRRLTPEQKRTETRRLRRLLESAVPSPQSRVPTQPTTPTAVFETRG